MARDLTSLPSLRNSLARSQVVGLCDGQLAESSCANVVIREILVPSILSTEILVPSIQPTHPSTSLYFPANFFWEETAIPRPPFCITGGMFSLAVQILLSNKASIPQAKTLLTSFLALVLASAFLHRRDTHPQATTLGKSKHALAELHKFLNVRKHPPENEFTSTSYSTHTPSQRLAQSPCVLLDPALHAVQSKASDSPSPQKIELLCHHIPCARHVHDPPLRTIPESYTGTQLPPRKLSCCHCARSDYVSSNVAATKSIYLACTQQRHARQAAKALCR